MDAQLSVNDGSQSEQAPGPRVGEWAASGDPFVSAWDRGVSAESGCPAGRHHLRVEGYLLGPRPLWLDCDRPLRVLCSECPYETRWACSGHRESRCKPCSARYRRRVGSVAISGTRRNAGWHYLVTLTAPGRERHRMPSGDWCSCTPEGGVHLARWNATHSRRWNHFRTRLRRDHPGLEFFRGVEVQHRGALHDHAMVWSPTPLRKRDIKALALAAGFGHSVDLAPITSAQQVGYYVSKYVTKATDSRDEVPWVPDGHELVEDEHGQVLDVDSATGEVKPARAAYRTWSMSRQWGLTMRAVRAEAAEYAAALRAREDMDGMSELIRAFGDGWGFDDTPPSPS
jgi:hypothetical protein